jgi:hypothetical protein
MKTNSSTPMTTSKATGGTMSPSWWWLIGPSMIYWITLGIAAAAARLPSCERAKMATSPQYGRR